MAAWEGADPAPWSRWYEKMISGWKRTQPASVGPPWVAGVKPRSASGTSRSRLTCPTGRRPPGPRLGSGAGPRPFDSTGDGVTAAATPLRRGLIVTSDGRTGVVEVIFASPSSSGRVAGRTLTAPVLSGVGSVTLTSAPFGSCGLAPLAMTSPALTVAFVASRALPLGASYDLRGHLIPFRD